MIPVLMITWNRLDYTKQALPALLEAEDVSVIVIDNGSTDGTVEWLGDLPGRDNLRIHYNPKNLGIAGAMNQFILMTVGSRYVGKVDNDTVVPPGWATALFYYARKLQLDIIQARHPLISETAHGRTFDEWTDPMPYPDGFPEIRLHHFVGGSGIIIRRRILTKIPETDWKLYGWRQFQRETKRIKIAFCRSVTIRLLDEGGAGFRDFPAYYRSTGRLK